MKKTNETGRSMVEMLGVLAIIGVLSVGGIAGYTMAMRRYRANEMLDAAQKYAVILYTGKMTAATQGISNWNPPTYAESGLATTDDDKAAGADITVANADAITEDGVTLTIATTEELCKTLETVVGVASNTACGSNYIHKFKQS